MLIFPLLDLRTTIHHFMLYEKAILELPESTYLKCGLTHKPKVIIYMQGLWLFFISVWLPFYMCSLDKLMVDVYGFKFVVIKTA